MSIRKIEILRATWGAALLIAPERVLTDVHHLTVDRKSLVVARILGLRHLTQAALSGIAPSPEVLAMGIWVDAAHAATALGLAVTDRSRTRAGLADTAIAAIFAAFGNHDLAEAGSPVPGHDRRRDALARWTLSHLPGGARLLRTAEARDKICN